MLINVFYCSVIKVPAGRTVRSPNTFAHRVHADKVVLAVQAVVIGQ